jgi:hypothetical protein
MTAAIMDAKRLSFWRPARTLGAVIGAAQIRAFCRSDVDSKCRAVLPGEPSLQQVTRGRWERVRWLMTVMIVTGGAGDDLRCLADTVPAAGELVLQWSPGR